MSTLRVFLILLQGAAKLKVKKIHGTLGLVQVSILMLLKKNGKLITGSTLNKFKNTT